MDLTEIVRELISKRLNRILLVAETALPASQFHAFRKVVLDEFGNQGFGKELERTVKNRHD